MLATALSKHLLKTGEGLLHACISSYKRLTNSHSYLLLCSSHPITPKDPFLSLSSFVFAEDENFQAKRLEKGIFLQRGYPTFLLNTAFSKAAQIPRSEILTDPDVTGNNQIPLVLTYHPFNFKVGNVIRKNFDVLRRDPTKLPYIFHFLR